MENWKDIQGYESLYQVSDFGRIKSLGRMMLKGRGGTSKFYKEKILNPTKSRPYLQVALCRECNKKYLRVNRLVAIAFIPNPLAYPEVNHEDGVKFNNKVSNLTWCTRSQNLSHAVKTGLRKVPPSQKGSIPWNKKIKAA